MILIFATFEIGGLSLILTRINKTLLSLLTSFISVLVALNSKSMLENFDLIALTVLEI